MSFLSLIIILILFDGYYVVNSGNIPICDVNGVEPNECKLYSNNNEYFDCGGNTQRKIPIKYINDDYCDCPQTGRDEPGTSACIVGKFYCNNIGYYGKYIYSSWVNDGKCDCCDGSDEWNNPRISCPNVCNVKAETELKKYKEQKEQIELGLSKLPQMIKSGNANINEQKAQQTLIKKEVEILEQTCQELKSKKEDLEQKEREYREILEAKREEEEQKKLEDQLDGMKDNEPINDNTDTNAEPPTPNTDATNDDSNASNDNNDNNENNVDDGEIKHTPDEEFPYSDKYKPPENNDEIEHTPDEEFPYSDKYKPPDNEDEGGNDENGENGFDWSEFEDEESEPKVDTQESPEAVEEAPKDPILIEKENAAREARDEYNTKNRELNDKKNELTKIDKILNIDYGHGNLFASLINECFETKVNKYTYKFCPFNEVRQKENNVGSGTNLGSYKSIIYNDKIIMEFDNGQKCWNGPNRSTKIIFECYHENKIKSVQEPSTCKYEMTFQTPLGCKHSHIKDIDDIIINTFKSEL